MLNSLGPSLARTARELRLWPRTRWYVGAVAFALVLAFMVLASDVVSQAAPANLAPAAAWWVYPVVGVGSLLAGMIVASYIRSPRGAEATFCDLRWPLLGVTGIALATGSRETARSLAGLLDGAPGSPADLTRLFLGLAAIAVMAWGLHDRLARERAVAAAAGDSQDGAAGVVCETCRPLFPQRSPRLPSP